MPLTPSDALGAPAQANKLEVVVLEAEQGMGGRLARGSPTPGLGLRGDVLPLGLASPLATLCAQLGVEPLPYAPAPRVRLYDTSSQPVPEDVAEEAER